MSIDSFVFDLMALWIMFILLSPCIVCYLPSAEVPEKETEPAILLRSDPTLVDRMRDKDREQ